MKNHFLLPSWLRPLGLLLLPLFVFLIGKDVALPFLRHTPVHSGIVVDDNASLEVWLLGLLLSLIFIAFARLRVEDEYTAHLRLRALVQSVYVNFGLGALLIFFTHGFAFIFYAAMHSLALLAVFSILFYGRILLRRSATAASPV